MSSRSVFRLLTTLAHLNFPLTDDRPVFGGPTRHYLAESYVRKLPNMLVPQLSLTSRECLVLYLLLAHDAVFADSEIEEDLDSLKTKLSVLLPPTTSSVPLSSLFGCIPDGTVCYRGFEAILDVLYTGLTEHRALRLSVSSPSEPPTSLVVLPLRLLEHRNRLYLAARHAKSDTLRLLAIEHIRTTKLLSTVFAYPASLDLQPLLASLSPDPLQP